ncbi:RHE_PE00001 family protein [Rhizobium sp.]|uniref:RHE_PE00001 family protein n=1 Tax=Rhizobium sp. TaxID=391 RepID=UPI0028A9671A
MISMSYDLTNLPIQSLLKPVFEAGTALARLDERIARSEVGSGFLERQNFADACASLWIDGELVHLEDLVLHDANHDIRTPTHELTIARDVLRTRRRIAAQPPNWALSPDGLRSLRGHNIVAGQAWPAASLDDSATESKDAAVPVDAAEAGEGEDGDDASVFDAELAAIDAVLARSDAVLKSAAAPASQPRDRDPIIYDPDWDEDTRLEEWRTVLRQAENLPPVLQAIVAVDAWNTLDVLQHAPWLGRHLAASILRQGGIATGAHLVAINLGLKTIPVDRRRHRSREVRLLAIADGLIAAAEIGLKEHDRLALARKMMERKLRGRRVSSKLPELVDLVMAMPLVHAGTVTKTLGVRPQAARRIVLELGLREMTGRGRFRAWGIM